MFALQASIDGKVYVTIRGVIVGKAKLPSSEMMDFLRLYLDEFHQQLMLVKSEIDNLKSHNTISATIEDCSLMVRQRVKMDLRTIIDSALYPMRTDGLQVEYIQCKKTWVIKPSVTRVKAELRLQGVIE